MMDINFTSLAALAAMIIWGLYRKFCSWKWPNEAAGEAMEEAVEREKINAEEIRALQKEHRKEIHGKIKSFWDKIFAEKDD